jgi:hypothetical protein
MAITVITPAQDFDLTTLANLKSRLKITDASLDSELTRMITGVSKSLMRKINRQLARETVRETVKGYGDTQLMLSRSPVISVSSVLEDGVTPVLDYSIEDPESSILYRRSGWSWGVVNGFTGVGFNPLPNSEEANYTIEYEAGYYLPNWTPGTPDLPEDIEDLALDYMHFLYANRNEEDPSIRSYSIGQITVGKSTQTAVVDFLADFERRCLDYKRIV